MWIESVIVSEGTKNALLEVHGIATGNVEDKLIQILKFADMSHSPRGVRIDSILWVIKEKMYFDLWWMKGGQPLMYIMPAESRCAIRFDRPLHSVEGADGIGLTISNYVGPGPMGFMLSLDMEKLA